MREPVNVTIFGPDIERDIENYLFEQIEWLEREHKSLHENQIPKWRKSYLGTPAEENKSFPWPNAANTVVQVVGETVDNAVARTLGLIYATHPLWVFQNYYNDPKDTRGPELRRRMLQDYMDIIGNQPSELDLYRIQGQWYTDTCRLGTGFVKVNIEHMEEAVVTGYTSAKKIKGHDETIYSGPKVIKLRHEDVMGDPTSQTVEECPVFVQRRTLKRQGLEERMYNGAYDKAKVKTLLQSPDRTSPRNTQREELEDDHIDAPSGSGASNWIAEWDLYECYFHWWHDGRKFALIYTYHKRSRTVLRKVFNFVPKNRKPFIRAKLGYRTDGLYGHGYAEMLERYQEELTTIHNQRLDNATIANVRALRVSPHARNLDANFELYPGALLVGEKDEIEAVQVGDVYNSSFQNEQSTQQLVQTRAGISPSTSGMSTGGMQKRPAVYSSQGTMAVMQENNTRTGHATSEFRHAHSVLGDMIASISAHFGIDGKEKIFGENGKYLLEALEDYKSDKLYIPIRSSNATLNRESDKQNDMIMVGVIQRHYQAISQLMQAVSNPAVDPVMKDYFVKVIRASDAFMHRIIKDFGHEQPEQFVPEPQLQQDRTPDRSNERGQMAPGGSSVGGAAPAPAPTSAAMAPIPGGSGSPAGPPGEPIPASR